MHTSLFKQPLFALLTGTWLTLISNNCLADSSAQASVFHISGYGDISYLDVENGNSGFKSLHFNPVFNFQFTDIALFEGEAEMEVDENGESELNLEYANINLFLNNNMTLVAGKFLSPVGYFRQNLHPSWINKLPTAPPGFGHDGAAPIADIGIQLRGVSVTDQGARWHYALYSGNGPDINEVAGEIHGIESEGNTGNEDDKLVFGGRIAYQPTSNLEIGASAISGDVAITGEAGRDYSVSGVDFAWQTDALDLRGEFLKQEVDELGSSIAPESAEWETAYIQAAYRILPGNWEVVLRYTDFTSPHDDESQEQTALGLNYLFASNLIGKLAYHSNSNDSGSEADDDVISLQLSYGF